MNAVKELVFDRLSTALDGECARGVQRQAFEHLDEVDQPLHRLAVEVRRPVHQRVLVIESAGPVARLKDRRIAQNVRKMYTMFGVVLFYDSAEARQS